MHNIPKELHLPNHISAPIRKKARRQRAKYGCSELDLLDADIYLLGVLACAMEYHMENGATPAWYYDYDTGTLISDPSDTAWREELRKADAACRALLNVLDETKSVPSAEVDRAPETRMKLFAWLGRNLGCLWA